jgi:hypothetical protein
VLAPEFFDPSGVRCIGGSHLHGVSDRERQCTRQRETESVSHCAPRKDDRMLTSKPENNVVARGRLILAGLLLLYHPTAAALHIAAEITALPVRGLPLGIGMLGRLAVTAIGFAAGMALLKLRPGADRFAQFALALSLLFEMVVYSTSIFPNNRAPGDTSLYAAASIVYHGAWIIYLQQSRPRGSL